MFGFFLLAFQFVLQTTNNLYNKETSRFTVLLANYRDVLCGPTILNIFNRAHNPERIYVIIAQETYPGDDDCYSVLEDSIFSLQNSKFKIWLNKNLSIIRKKASEAVGLHMNVYQAHLLLPDDSGFLLKIDSHSDFLPNYDIDMIDLFNRVGDENAIFSNHTLTWSYRTELINNKSPPFVSTTCALLFLTNNIFFLYYNEFIKPGDFKCFETPGACRSSMLVASNIFGRAHFLSKVPYDKYMSYLFYGEEPLYAIRLYTHGYNLYLPKYNFVFHYAQPNKTLREKFEAKRNFDDKVYQKTLNRFRLVLDLDYDKNNVENREIEKFGMGKERTVKEFFEFIGINDYKNVFKGAKKESKENRSACKAFIKLNRN